MSHKTPEFILPDYNCLLEETSKLIDKCIIKIKKNIVESIPDINKILERELEAIKDNLTIVDHYHAAARCTRAAIELAAKNLCFTWNLGTGKIGGRSFSDKYKVEQISSKKHSPLRKLISLGIIDEELFNRFQHSYSELSTYVHNRVSYELAHTRPDLFENEYWYSKVAWVASEKSQGGRDVKASLIKYTLIPGLETLYDLIEKFHLTSETHTARARAGRRKTPK